MSSFTRVGAGHGAQSVQNPPSDADNGDRRNESKTDDSFSRGASNESGRPSSPGGLPAARGIPRQAPPQSSDPAVNRLAGSIYQAYHPNKNYTPDQKDEAVEQAISTLMEQGMTSSAAKELLVTCLGRAARQWSDEANPVYSYASTAIRNHVHSSDISSASAALDGPSG